MACAVLGLAGLSGCAASDWSSVTDKLPPYEISQSRPKNVIERAMALCPEKLENSEAECIRKELAEANISFAGLVQMVPGCRVGKSCDYAFTTVDRLGFISATTSTFVVRWRVTFDVSHPAIDAAHVPISVAQV